MGSATSKGASRIGFSRERSSAEFEFYRRGSFWSCWTGVDRPLPRSIVGSSFAILRQLVRNLIPWSTIIHVSVKLRPNSGIIIEGSHANRYLRTILLEKLILERLAGTA